MEQSGPDSVDLLVISGVSGSGKTTALRALEDAGWFCVDNLPAPLLETFVLLAEKHPGIHRVAVVMDVREASLYPDVARHMESVRSSGRPIHVLYLDSTDDKVITRFKETRRRHPLMGTAEAPSVADAIRLERAWLEPIRLMATTLIDTTGLNVHELKRRVQKLYADPGASEMAVHVMSFGFRHGMPAEADFVFDVRFLPNPYFVDALRPGTGLDEPVRDFVLEQTAAKAMLGHLQAMLVDVLPLAREEGKASVTIAIGCTGGRHRSVAIVEALRGRLLAAGWPSSVTHRDVDR